jgi:hypothetical protein
MKHLLPALQVILLMSGCYPDKIDTVDEYDLQPHGMMSQ